MSMKKKVKYLKGGEILSEPVYKTENEILIESNTVLKQEYLKLLFDFGISTVSVQDQYEPYERPHLIMQEDKKKEYVEKIRRILEGHIYRDIYHGNDSLRQVTELSKQLIMDLPDMKERVVFDIEPHDGNLYEHTFMVTALSICVGKRLELPEDKIIEIGQGCLLHDLGLRYVTVPYKDFRKEEHVSAEIFELKKHTILGYSALESAVWLSDTAKQMVLSHHEKTDGSGYPLKQRSKEIECLIIQVCDTFDCLISGMECVAQDIGEAIHLIDSNCGTLYDARVAEAFCGMVAHFPTGTIINHGDKTGVVTEQTNRSDCPVIKFLDEIEEEDGNSEID